MKSILSKLVPQKLKNYGHFLSSVYYHNKYNKPSEKMKIIGVTGTDGKTTTSNMLYKILTAAGYKVGLISTINARIGKKSYDTGFHVTTPSPKSLQKFLSEMYAKGLEYVILETTSHSLDQFRVGGIRFSGAVYTNITHEHLDYHGNYDNYFRAKSKMIDQMLEGGFIVINRDDKKSYKKLMAKAKNTTHDIFDYSREKNADIMAKDIEYAETWSKFKLAVDDNPKLKATIKLPMPGFYNIENALAAASAALALGASPKAIKQGLEDMKSLEGRWEVMQSKPFQVVVDFAHTPNSLELVLKVARKQIAKRKRVISVFGCAGLRDNAKRPLMGAAAAKLADFTVITAEDPRTEKVEDINQQIAQGFAKHKKKEGKDYINVYDRGEAITTALKMAKPGDIVLITGKGHELSMNLDGKKETPWSDQGYVKKILKKL